jgi:hypothetical protein
MNETVLGEATDAPADTLITRTNTPWVYIGPDSKTWGEFTTRENAAIFAAALELRDAGLSAEALVEIADRMGEGSWPTDLIDNDIATLRSWANALGRVPETH